MQKISAKATAWIGIVPKGSQVVLTALVVVLLFCFACTFFSTPLGINPWFPFVAALILLVVIVVMWHRSAQAVDDAAIPAVNIVSTDGINSTSVSVHHRSLSALQKAQLFETFLSIFQYRKPLPEPDGLIDENGEPVPQSLSAAQARVDAANRQAQQDIEGALSKYQGPVDLLDRTSSGKDVEPEATGATEAKGEAKVEAGEAVVIARQDRAMAHNSPVARPKTPLPLEDLAAFRAAMPPLRRPSAELLREARDEGL